MTDVISRKKLESRVDYLNKQGAGLYRIDYAYGGVSLEEKESGNDVFHCGHVSKRELYNRINAFIEGIQVTRRITAPKGATHFTSTRCGEANIFWRVSPASGKWVAQYDRGWFETVFPPKESELTRV